MDAEDFVQTRAKVLVLATWVANVSAPQNWYFAIGMYLFDLAVTISSLYYNWSQWPPVALMLFNLLICVVKVPFITFYKSFADRKLESIKQVFDRLDTDKDGFLTREQVEQLLVEFPNGTFEKEFSEKLELVSLDVVMWCTAKQRILFFRMLEFLGSLSMFFAALMLFTPGMEANAVIYVQGVQSALGLVLVLSDVLEEHGKKYHPTTRNIQVFVNFLYWFMLIAALVVLLSGYAIVARLYEEKYTFSFNITKTFPVDDAVGAVGGGILTAMITVLLAVYFMLFTCGGRCGGCKVYVNHLGEDDPIKLLKRGQLFKKKASAAAAPPQQQEMVGRNLAKGASSLPDEARATVVPPPPPPPPFIPKQEDLNVV